MRAAVLAFAAITAFAVTAPAVAQAPPANLAHIRGKVASLIDNTLVVDKREGGKATILLAPTWSLIQASPIKADEIKPGSFIGTTEKPGADGHGTSLEVHVFPPGVKQGEGHYDWDREPGSMMTNGSVETVVTGVSGRELTVSYTGGQRKITVPPAVPIVGFGPGDKAALKPGAGVFIIAKPNPDGSFVTDRVVTGANGAAPPM